MKKIFTLLQLCFLGIIAILASSCQHEKLSEVVKPQSFSAVSGSLSARIDVAAGSSYTLDGSNVTVPATITFSSAATSAFTVNLATNVDTVANLVTAGTLPTGTVAFANGTAAVVPQITVPAGVTSVSFNIIVSRSYVELNYGKLLAAVVKLSAPSKGNKIGQGTMLFTLKTADILDAASIHTLGFTGATNNVFNPSSSSANYTVSSVYVTVTVPVKLQGDLGAAFTADVVSVPDSVTKYINNGTLPNSSLYADSKFSISNAKIVFNGTTNQNYLTFVTKTVTLLGEQPAPATPSVKMPTIGFKLQNPTKYQINPKTSMVFVTLDANFFRPYYGTPFLIKGTIGTASDPIYAAYYDYGGEGIAYHNDKSKNGDGGWRAPDYVDVSSDYSPRSVVGWNNSGEWLSYSIYVQQAGTYEVNTMLGSPNNGQTYSIFIDGALINAKLVVINTTNYSNQGPNLSTLTLTAGYHIIKAYWDNAAYDFRGFILTRKS